MRYLALALVCCFISGAFFMHGFDIYMMRCADKPPVVAPQGGVQ